MKIAYILPSLAAKAPVFLALELAKYFKSKGNDVTVFYFDNKVECDQPCLCKQINFNEKINFDDYDIIHSHMFRPYKYVSKNKKIIKHAKCISTIHCDIFKDLKDSYGL